MSLAIKERFMNRLREIKGYEEALAVLYWDLRTGAPRKGIGQRSQVIGMLSTESFKLTTSEEMGQWLEQLSQPEQQSALSAIEKRCVEVMRRKYERSTKIPMDMYKEYVTLASESESIWEEAKDANHFAKFQPYLERIVSFNQQFVELWGYEENRYDALLDDYEPGMTVRKLDELFGALRERLVPLVAAVKESGINPNSDFLKQHFNKQKQRAFSEHILKQIGYDFAAGRLDESVHPFATGLNPGDVRITTNFKPNDLAFALFGTIHECGHALYEQNIAPALIGTPLSDGASMGIHESQSRFWEIIVGSSLPFWKRYMGDLHHYFPGQLEQIDAEAFYRAINKAQPSFIRIEADELTYNLHILIRYEIEKLLINEQIKVADLPQIWNAKYKEYLGVEPRNDAEGVLQDVHWSDGSFGYFPSYSLGNMYAAQFANTLRRELPQFDSLIEQGDFTPIKDWLTEHIYQHGLLLTPAEIVQGVTGESLNGAYLMDYLETKYSSLYGLK